MSDREGSLGGVPRLQFSKKLRQQYESKSDDLVEKTLTVYDEFHGKNKHVKTANTWKLVKRKKSLNIYREQSKIKSREDRMHLCSGVMPGSVEDMITGAYADDMESMRISLTIMAPMFLDARMVHVFDKNPITSSVVFSGIKWMALKTSISPTLIHDRDILFYNRLGRIIDSQGRYFVYCVMYSVDLDEYPANRQHNMKRGLMSLCYLFRQFQEELVGCFIIGTSSMGGALPWTVGELITAERMLSVTNFLLVARAKAYSARIANSTDRMPSTSFSCDVCMKKPNILSGSFKLCMGCRRNTCRRCREWCTVFRLDPRTQKPGKETFCTQCIADVTRPTMSTFYVCSLNESTNTSGNQGSTCASISSGAKQSSSPSSSQSQEFSEIDSDAWLPAPPDLDGLANFVERASLANSRDMEWNQEELDYYTDILRESGHFKVPEFTGGTSQRTQSHKQDFHPGSSLPPPVQSKFDHKVSRSYAADDNSVHQKFFSIDDLD